MRSEPIAGRYSWEYRSGHTGSDALSLEIRLGEGRSMCGYIRRVTDSPAVREMLEQIGLGGRFSEPVFRRWRGWAFLPGVRRRPGAEDSPPNRAGAERSNNRGRNLVVWRRAWRYTLRLGKRTTFNARNLDSPYWKGALYHH